MHFAWLLILVMLVGVSKATGAQPTFPSKPVRLIVATSAGGQPDTVARIIAQKLSEAWGYPIVVDDRPAAAGMVAASAVAKAVPDGHTLLYAPPNLAINAATQTNLPYDTFKDFAPVAHVGISTNVLVASPAVAGGRIYIGATDGRLYAFGKPAAKP